MTQIPLVVEKNCSSHPLLRKGAQLPREETVHISAQRLFGFATLKLQDPRVGRRTYADTYPLWQSLNQQYGVYLDFSPKDLMTIAEVSEDITTISEIVGIGCGLAALNSQFAININRFSRFTPGGSQKRVDFEFYAEKRRYFHETKGTTYENAIPQLRKDILAQKHATQKYCKKTRPKLKASTGSITLYQHTKRTNFNSRIILLDPPGPDDETIERYRESHELSCVLRYYHNFYSVTHMNVRNAQFVSLDRWLPEVIESLEVESSAPNRPPEGLLARGRSSEPNVPDSRYRGTIFDARVADRSVRTYRTFDEASAAIKNPMTFIGVSEDVTELIRLCRWDRLLEYSDRGSTKGNEHEGTTIFESGVMAKLVPGDEATENSNRGAFVLLRQRAEQQGRLLPTRPKASRTEKV